MIARPIASALLSIAALAGIAAAQADLPLRVVTISGKGEVYQKGTDKWTEAALKADVGPGGGARALAGSRLTLRSPSGQSLRLGARSRLTVLEPAGPDQPTRVKLETGALWVAVVPDSPPRETVVVETGAASIAVRGGGVWVTLAPEGAIQVRVFHGGAEVSGPGARREWTRALAADSDLFVPAVGTPAPVRKLEREKLQLDWVKWNEDQDRAGGYAAKAVPP